MVTPTGGVRRLEDLDLAGKRVLIRVDLNVPMQDGAIGDDTRIRAAAPTIRAVLAQGGIPLVLSHFGRPKGQVVPALSLAALRAPLETALGAPVAFCPACTGPAVAAAVAQRPQNGAILLENTRFHPGEERNDPEFADALAAHGDVFVNDAFSAAHRAHASTTGLAYRLPSAAGMQMAAELAALEAALTSPQRPVMAVVGGAKVSTKLDLLGNLVARVDALAVGGAMANTFLLARGLGVGRSLVEAEMTDTAADIVRAAERAGCALLLPVDVVVADAFAAHAPHRTVPSGEVPPEGMILDAGPLTVAALCARMDAARSLVWNGPLGAFELPPFDAGTAAAARHAAARTRAGALMSVAGGGDTVAALNAAGVAGDFSYVSTAGGAFLEWLEGKTLPGVAAMGG